LGDGLQPLSFLYVDECLEGVRRQMDSTFTGSVNTGSDEMVTINQLGATWIRRILASREAAKHCVDRPSSPW
jgi:nucleoside-diphosphate-sugar epimerase